MRWDENYFLKIHTIQVIRLEYIIYILDSLSILLHMITTPILLGVNTFGNCN